MENAQRYIDENKMGCLANSLLEWSNRSNISHNNKKQNVCLTSNNLHPKSSSTCFVNKQGGQTGLKLHLMFVFKI